MGNAIGPTNGDCALCCGVTPSCHCGRSDVTSWDGAAERVVDRDRDRDGALDADSDGERVGECVAVAERDGVGRTLNDVVVDVDLDVECEADNDSDAAGDNDRDCVVDRVIVTLRNRVCDGVTAAAATTNSTSTTHVPVRMSKVADSQKGELWISLVSQRLSS